MKINKTLSSIILCFKNVVISCPSRLLLDFLAKLVSSGIYLFLDVIFLGYIIKMCELQYNFTRVVLFISISMLAIFWGKMFVSWYSNRYVMIADQQTKAKLNSNVFKKATNVDVVCYEDTDFFDRFSRVMSEYCSVNMSVYSTIKDIVVILLESISVLIIIINVDPMTLLFSIIPFLFLFLFGKKSNKLRVDLKKENTKYERKAAYTERVVYQKEYAKELRLFRIYEPLKRNFDDAIAQLSKNIHIYGKRIALVEFLQKILSENIMYFGLLVYLTFRATQSNGINLSDWLVLLNSAVSFANKFQRLADKCLSLYTNSKYVELFEEYFQYQPKIPEDFIGEKISNGSHYIEFKNVSFTYKGMKKPVLKNINLYIAPNEKIAIVGCNGAGKSTLIKLLLRLYDPDDGIITCDNKDIKLFTVEDYRTIFATVMQDSKIFALSVGENVLMRTINKFDKKEIETALEESTFNLENGKLKFNIDSILTKEFDDNGIVLSGGETQKIAIARAVAANRDVIVLDEPSSALDPIAEDLMFKSMFDICANKSAVLISHRLANVVSADRIYVMNHGEIVEVGNHTELMQLNGLYADMFKKQSENYLIGQEI